MVDASVTALCTWIGEQRINVQLFAEDEKLLAAVQDLLSLADGSSAAERALVHAKAQESLRLRLRPRLQLSGYVGYFVVAPSGTVLAADQDSPVGKTLAGYQKEIFERAVAGQFLVSKPFRSLLLLPDDKGDSAPTYQPCLWLGRCATKIKSQSPLLHSAFVRKTISPGYCTWFALDIRARPMLSTARDCF